MKIDIGNIRAKSSIKIIFTYVEELDASVNKFWKFKIPATIAPRYCNDPIDQD